MHIQIFVATAVSEMMTSSSVLLLIMITQVHKECLFIPQYMYNDNIKGSTVNFVVFRPSDIKLCFLSSLY